MHTRTLILLPALAAAPAVAAPGDVQTFLIPIPEIGTTLFFSNDLIPGSNDFNGGEIIDARLDLVLDVVASGPDDPRISSAAHFRSEVIVPVDVDPVTPGGQLLAVRINGEDEGWDGTGTFTISRQLDAFIGGTWVSPTFYSATTDIGVDSNNVVLGTVNPFISSFISITVREIPAPSGVALIGAAGLLAARRRR